MQYANNKGADQPAHPRSLISAIVVRCLDSIIPLVSISETSSLYLASMAVQASPSLTWSQTPKTGFLVTWLICFSGISYWYLSHCTIKPTKWPVRPAKTDQPVHPSSLIGLHCLPEETGSWATHKACTEVWSDWVVVILLVLSCCESFLRWGARKPLQLTQAVVSCKPQRCRSVCISGYCQFRYEPPHDKSIKMAFAPSKDSD